MLSATDQDRMTEALRFAPQHHADQYRKGSSIPYVSHLLQVAGLVLEFGGDVDQAVAALLHDTLEDCPEVTVGSLEERFGAAVTGIVRDCSDTIACEAGPDAAKPSWRERKERYLAHMKCADTRSLLVAVCDKVHNLGTIVADLEEHGLETLGRFSADADGQAWYFRNILDIARERVPSILSRRLEQSLTAFTAAVAS